MNRRHAIVLATVAALTSGCATTSRIDATTPVPVAPTALRVNQQPHPAGTIDLTTVTTTSPDDVARAVVTTLNQYDTRTDTSPADAAGRAAPLLTPDLATDLATAGTRTDSTRTDSTRTDSTWLDLEQHDGYTTATTNLANEYGQPSNTASTAYVQLSVDVTWTGRDGWTHRVPSQLVRLVLIKQSEQAIWRVGGFFQ